MKIGRYFTPTGQPGKPNGDMTILLSILKTVFIRFSSIEIRPSVINNHRKDLSGRLRVPGDDKIPALLAPNQNDIKGVKP
jgi:hypothetical protein